MIRQLYLDCAVPPILDYASQPHGQYTRTHHDLFKKIRQFQDLTKTVYCNYIETSLFRSPDNANSLLFFVVE